MSSAEASPAPDSVDAEASDDERRAALLARFEAELGDSLVASHLRPGDDLWMRVRTDAWRQAADVARNRLGFRYFCFLSILDWLPSPFGRYEDAEVDEPLDLSSATAQAITPGYTGGDTRFQVFARVTNVVEHEAVTLKADIPDDTLRVDSWLPIYNGADWHEREAWEMFGITFVDHPHLAHLYLPGDFEGNPLRKDFPLLARVVKPWPGIVDVEPMPGETEEPSEGEAEASEGDSQ